MIFKVYSVESDAFRIHEDVLTRVMGEPNHLTNKSIFWYNDLIEIPKLENGPTEVVDEWDTPGICKQVEKQNPCVIRSKFSGSGKSYTGLYF